MNPSKKLRKDPTIEAMKPSELCIQFEDNREGSTIVKTDGVDKVAQLLTKLKGNTLLNLPKTGTLHLYEACGYKHIDCETPIQHIQLDYDERGRQEPLIVLLDRREAVEFRNC
jgi:hypothetical protein